MYTNPFILTLRNVQLTRQKLRIESVFFYFCFDITSAVICKAVSFLFFREWFETETDIEKRYRRPCSRVMQK